MSRPDLAAELDAVTRHLVLLAALVENLARSVRSRQDGPEARPDLAPVPVGSGAAPGKGNAGARRGPRAPGSFPGTQKRILDGTDLPVCTCPPCLAERASGRRP
jgi:hypothetical protein